LNQFDDYNFSKNSSTVQPEHLINDLSVPIDSSLCWGIDKFALSPILDKTR
jgi:hypothetical protein